MEKENSKNFYTLICQIGISIFVLALSACCLQQARNLASAPQTPPLAENCDCERLDIETIMRQPPDWEYNFEHGWNAQDGKGDRSNRNADALPWRYSQMQTDETGEVIPDPQNANNLVMKFLWQNGAGEQYDANTQKKAHLYGAFGEHSTQEEVWSFDVYFPSTSMPSDSEPEIFAQWHGVPDDCEIPRNPPISIENKADRLSVTWRYDQRECTPWGFDRWDADWKGLGETPKDQWINFVVAIQWDPFGCGVLELWMDGEKMLDEVEIPLGFNDAQGAYLGFGIYKYTQASDRQQRMIYFDNLRQWVIP